MAVERTGPDNVDLLTVTAPDLEGSIIDGRGGEDILELAGGSFRREFDFRSVASFTGIERIRRLSSSHSVIFSSWPIGGFKSLENPNRGSFALMIDEANVDFRNKTVERGIEVKILTDGATFTVNDVQVAEGDGHDVAGETLIVQGSELSAAERRRLHSQGIDRVQDATGVITEDLAGPSISGLGSRMTVSPWPSLPSAAPVSLSEDIGLSYMSVLLDRLFWGQEELLVDQSGAVRIETDEWARQHITVNGRVVAQAFLASSSLQFRFNPEATVADIQEILRSIIYESSGGAMPAQSNKLTISLIDLAHE